MKLLSKNNTKTLKGEILNIMTWGLSLVPNKMNGKKNLCVYASKGCIFACLETAGMGVFPVVREARMNRTMFFVNNQKEFLSQLEKEISDAEKIANRAKMKCAIRLNVLSDVAWHKLIDFSKWPNIQFYDYTPNTPRMIQFLQGKLPKNYHLTYSRKENNQAAVEVVSAMGGNVAVVFDKLPREYLNKRVVNGDETDVRFLDGKGVIVGLKAKGRGKKDESGFVIKSTTANF